MIRTFLTFCLSLFIFSFLSAQDLALSGYINDAKTGESLIGATVYNRTNQASSVANTYGFYSIPMVNGENEIIVFYVGYQQFGEVITLTENQQLNIDLTPEDFNIEEVTIIITDEELKLINTEMSVNKLSSGTIKNIPAVAGEVDIVKAIQLLPGVTNNGEGANGFNVRGGGEDQNLVLLDEAVIYNTAHLFGFFSIFNNDAIKDVKLYKGGIPSKYGGRASSVLDVQQKDGNDQEFHGNGGIGLISSRLLLEGPIKKEQGSFLLAGRSSYLHLFLPLADNDNDLRFYDLNAKASYELDENNSLFLSGYFGNDVFGLNEFLENSYGNESANLRWNHIFNQKLFSNLSLIYSRYRYNFEFNALDFDWESGITNFNGKYDFTWFTNDKITVDYGISGIHYDFNPGVISPTSPTSDINFDELDEQQAFEGGLYISANQDLTDKLTAEYGLRYSNFFRFGQQLSTYENNRPITYNPVNEVYESAMPTGEITESGSSVAKSFHNLEPRLALAYQINDKSAVKASYNRIAQYLHLISNTSSPTPLDVWAPSGDFFEPQLANQFAVGYFRNFRDNDYSLEVESYYKTIDNRLDYIDGANLVANNNVEQVALAGETRSYGAEFLFKKNTGNLTGWAAYTLARAEQRTPGGLAGGPGINDGEWYRTNFDRTHDLSITGIYEFSPKWTFSSNFVLQSGRPVTYPDAQYQFNGISVASFGERNSNRLPVYHRFDVAATLRPQKNKDKDKKIKGEWVFSAYNLYSRENANSIQFIQDLETGQNQASRLAIFGIVPSVTWNFKF